MLLEVVDLLRCTRAHDDFPLVASIRTRADREIISGMLGCPACGTEYPIENGTAVFGDGASVGPARAPDPYAEGVEDEAVRCAAMLDLLEPGGAAVLAGSWMRGAAAIAEMTRTTLILVNPPSEIRLGHGISGVRIGTTLPLAAASVRGVALDEPAPAPALLASAARAIKAGGRLIGPVAATIPDGMTERARDDRHWVAEAGVIASPPVQLVKGGAR